MLKRTGAKTDPRGTPFLRYRNPLCLMLPVVKMKMRLPTSCMIMRAMYLTGNNCNSLQMRWHAKQFRRLCRCCEIYKHSSGLFLC